MDVKPMKSVDYINKMNKDLGWTDYRIAKNLGIAPSNISAFRKGEAHAFSDRNALKIADYLGLEPTKVVADMNYARAKSKEEKAFWRRLRNSATTTAAAAIFSLTLSPQPVDAADNSAPGDNSQVIYYAQLLVILIGTVSRWLYRFSLPTLSCHNSCSYTVDNA